VVPGRFTPFLPSQLKCFLSFVYQTVYDKAVEEIQQRYEAITNEFNAEIDAVRAETHYKWVQQVLAETDEDDEPEATGEEL